MNHDRDRVVVAFYSSFLALFLAALYALCRTGFGIGWIPLGHTLGLSFFLILLPDATHFLGRKNREHPSWFTSQAAVLLAGLGLAIGAGNLQAQSSLFLLPVFSGLGLLFFVVLLMAFIRKPMKPLRWGFVVFGLFAVWAGSIVWSQEYELSPVFLENLVRGWGHPDTTFHAALSHMIKTYSTVTVGLDGLSHVSYHTASHWAYAQLAKLLNINSFLFYNLAYPVIFIPLFLKSLLSFILDLRRLYKIPSVGVGGGVFWLILSAGFIGIIPYSLLDLMTAQPSYLFTSESYLFAFLLTFLVGSLSIAWIQTPETKKANRLSFLIVALPILLGLIGFAKISSLFVLVALLLYLIARTGLWKRPVYLLSAGLVVLITYFAYASCRGFEPGIFATKISLFHFIRWQVEGPVRPFFLWVYFFWTWLYLYMRIRETGITSWSQLSTAIRSRSLIDAEIVLWIAVVGFIPGCLLFVPGGSALFFSSIQHWVSLAFFVAVWPRFSPAFYQATGTRQNPKRVFILFITLPLLWSYASNIVEAGRNLAMQNLMLRLDTMSLQSVRSLDFDARATLGSTWTSPIKKAMVFLSPQHPAQVEHTLGVLTQQPMDNLKNNPRYQLLEQLSDLGQGSQPQRRDTAIFIPKSNQLYWDIPGRCEKNAFIAPALSGSSMIDGLPPADCHRVGRGTYAYPLGRETLSANDKAGMCLRAHEQGAHHVLIFKEEQGQSIEEDVTCPPA